MLFYGSENVKMTQNDLISLCTEEGDGLLVDVYFFKCTVVVKEKNK